MHFCSMHYLFIRRRQRKAQKLTRPLSSSQRRVTFSRVMIVNHPSTFIIAREEEPTIPLSRISSREQGYNEEK